MRTAPTIRVCGTSKEALSKKAWIAFAKEARISVASGRVFVSNPSFGALEVYVRPDQSPAIATALVSGWTFFGRESGSDRVTNNMDIEFTVRRPEVPVAN